MKKKHIRRPKTFDIYSVGHSLQQGQPNQMGVHELSDTEIYVIGEIAIQWAYLEHILLFDTAKMAQKAKFKRLPEYADSLSFNKRLLAWRLTVEETTKNGAKRKRLLKLAHRIGSLEADRHKVIHGLWRWFPSDPDRLCAHSFRPRVAFTDERYSLRRLSRIAERIAEVNYELTYPPPIRGKSKRNWLFGAAKSGTYSYMSRRFLLTLTGRDHAYLAPPGAKPRSQPPPQPSSPELPQQA